MSQSGQCGPFKRRNRKLTSRSIDFILAFCEKLRVDIRNTDNGKADLEVDEGYITKTMLNGIFNVLINEGYSRKHLNNFFFFEGEPNKHKEMTEEACKFYLPGHKKYSKIIEDFFYKNPGGIKLREEIDKLEGE